MRILAIETSCDETSTAVVERSEIPQGKRSEISLGGIERKIKVLSNITSTSLSLHAKTGGIIPENAAREQLRYIIPVIVEALLKSENVKSGSKEEDFKKAKQISKVEIDAIAVTHGPGLIGSLLVGVETAKTLSFTFDKPIIPVNHLLAHLFANFIGGRKITFPFIGLIVSGGHTDLLYFKSLNSYTWLGGTRDDAAGEALDKIGRLLNLHYPAGPEIERRARLVKENNLKFQSPLIDTKDFDFSFSGLKTEVSRFLKDKHLTEELSNEVSGAVQHAIFNVLIKKTIRAAKLYNCSTIILGGGVSANNTLFERFKQEAGREIQIFSPEKQYATDNAAMIGSYALLNYKPLDWHKVTADPDLYFV